MKLLLPVANRLRAYMDRFDNQAPAPGSKEFGPPIGTASPPSSAGAVGVTAPKLTGNERGVLGDDCPQPARGDIALVKSGRNAVSIEPAAHLIFVRARHLKTGTLDSMAL